MGFITKYERPPAGRFRWHKALTELLEAGNVSEADGWAPVREYKNEGTARRMATKVRQFVKENPDFAGRIEVDARGTNKIYARYVGEAGKVKGTPDSAPYGNLSKDSLTQVTP